MDYFHFILLLGISLIIIIIIILLVKQYFFIILMLSRHVTSVVIRALAPPLAPSAFN
jgi:hypothetical protein